MQYLAISLAFLLAGCGASCPAPVIPALPEPFYLSTCSHGWMRQEAAAQRLPACVAKDWRDATGYTLEVEAVRREASRD